MRYITRGLLSEAHTARCTLINRLSTFPVRMRGSLQREDIYFNYMDVTRLVETILNRLVSVEGIWIETGSGRIKYMTYEDLLRCTYGSSNTQINQFISAVDNALNSQFCCDQLSEMSDDSYDVVSESEPNTLDIDHYVSEINHYMTMAYQYKIDLLLQKLQTKHNQMLLMERDLTIMELRMAVELGKKNETIQELREQLALATHMNEPVSEWL